MNEAKVRSEIENILSKNNYKVWKQYPASKQQLAKLAELGIVDFIPRRAKGNVIGNTDAAMVIAEAEQDGRGSTGGFTACGDGDSARNTPSALYLALHEDTPDPENDDEANGEYTDDTYCFDDELDALIDEVAAIEQREYEAHAAIEEEALLAEAARLDELHPLSYFESLGLAKASTLRRAAIEGRLVAEKIGRDWFTSERDVRRFLDNRRKQHNTGVRLNAHVSVREAAGRLIVTIEELLWTGYESADAVNEMPLFPLAHDRLVHNREYEHEYEFPVVTDNRVKVVGVARAYECQGWRTRYTYYFAVMHDATVIVVHDDGKREYYSA